MMFTLQSLNHRLSICRLPGDSPVPEWAVRGGFWSITRSEDEISVVCNGNQVPEGVESEQDWIAFRVKGILDMSLTGVLSSLLQPLTDAEISVFAISTYNTDYLLVKAERYEDAQTALAPHCKFELRKSR